MATPSSIPGGLLKISGVIPLSQTIYTWQSLGDGGDPDDRDDECGVFFRAQKLGEDGGVIRRHRRNRSRRIGIRDTRPRSG